MVGMDKLLQRLHDPAVRQKIKNRNVRYRASAHGRTFYLDAGGPAEE